jgi:acyl-homoserine lactone acylase PvdQ
LVPALAKAFEKIPYADSSYAYLVGPVSVMKNWNYRSSENSIATTLAIEWGQKISPQINRISASDFVQKTKYFASRASAHDLLQPLSIVLQELKTKYGRWQVPWGEINRFQRISSNIENKFDESKPSLPVGFAASTWGMLPSFVSRTFPGTKKRYGYNGNSFVCAVEFVRKDSFGGKKIKAKSLLTGGQSGNENSKHFTDQALMYTKGEFKDVLFYKEDVMKHAERTYHPGE